MFRGVGPKARSLVILGLHFAASLLEKDRRRLRVSRSRLGLQISQALDFVLQRRFELTFALRTAKRSRCEVGVATAPSQVPLRIQPKQDVARIAEHVAAGGEAVYVVERPTG